jgi:hypothetical protein
MNPTLCLNKLVTQQLIWVTLYVSKIQHTHQNLSLNPSSAHEILALMSNLRKNHSPKHQNPKTPTLPPCSSSPHLQNK